MENLTGSTILHYRIEEHAGTGGMGEVYRAEDTRLKRRVALKFLLASHQFDPGRRARLLQEARAMSSLTSPHIVATYDFGEHEGMVFLVMEYVEGVLLSSKLEPGPLPVAEAVDIASQVADALTEAHARGIVHRDIKSQNLIVTERGLVKILDFGLAKFIDQAPDGQDTTVTVAPATLAGTVMGTGSYMSPEQALGKPVDHRTDLFSLGVVLYQMLTGRLPFEGNTITEVIDRIVHRAPAAVARFNYEVPEGLEAIVRKALEKDPDFRYQTARDLYIDLTHLQADLRSGGQAAGEARAAEPAPAGLEEAVAVLPFVNITKDPADDWIGDGIAETVSADMTSRGDLTVVGRERIQEALGDEPRDQEGDESHAIRRGRRLGVAWLVSGGYQRVNGDIRITARFMDVRTGGVIRTVKIDGRVEAIFELQDRVADELMSGLDPRAPQEPGPQALDA
jgi:TolB-like protein/tRNA A-37 threonylcarbamoyl transferase component Bud32